MRAIAAQLPIQYQGGNLVIKGEELIRQLGAVGKDAEGNKIDSDKWYKVPTQQAVNHYRRIKRLFHDKGYPAVQEYIDQVIRLHAEATVQHQKVLAGMPVMPTL